MYKCETEAVAAWELVELDGAALILVELLARRVLDRWNGSVLKGASPVPKW